MVQESGDRAASSVGLERRLDRPGGPAFDSYLVKRNGRLFAGVHLLVDFWGATNLTDEKFVAEALRSAAEAANATPLDLNIHKFSINNGVSGVILLAESHISIHTWPEIAFVAIDIFMCGGSDPYDCVETLKKAFEPAETSLFERCRGLVP